MAAENLAEFAIEVRGVLGGVLDELDPLVLLASETGLAEEVRGLHDGFERVAEVVSEGAQAGVHGSR